jgi:hypothetical protein
MQLRDGLRKPETGAPQLASVLDLADELVPAHVLRESPYIDHDYRSEFSQHFSRRFRPPPDRSERLIFLTKDFEAAGYCVLRPTAKPVARTVMNVPKELEQYVSCHARQEIRAYGRGYSVDGFPFMSQDGEYGRCAHAAIWSIARYHHAAHNTGRYSIAGIIDATGTGQLPDRTVMSGGLTVGEVIQALRRLGLPVLSYVPKRQLKGTNFVEVVCRYLDSGFPVAINTTKKNASGHLTVLVGYARDPSGQVHWIRCDDNWGPYEMVSDFDVENASDPKLGDWKAALVALPGRIHVPAEAAHAAAEFTFEKQMEASGGPAHLRDAWQTKKISARTYAVQPAKLKQDLFQNGSVCKLASFYLSKPTPVWAWVTEFGYADERNQVLGSVMIDATSSKHGPEPVVADIDGWGVDFPPNAPPKTEQIVASPVRYPSRLPDRTRATS